MPTHFFRFRRDLLRILAPAEEKSVRIEFPDNLDLLVRRRFGFYEAAMGLMD